MNTKGHLWISVILGLLAVLILFWLAPRKVYQARGVLLPTKQTRSAISSSTVIRIKNRPAGSELLGYINIERKYPAKNQLAQQQIWTLAQKLAAQVGANAIAITLFQVGAVTKGHYIYVFQAEAIYAPHLQSALDLMTYIPPIGMEF